MALPGMHHVLIAIPVGGEEAARQFYAELLGLLEVPKQANMRERGGLWFRTGNIDLHLGIDPEFRAAAKAHVAWQVADLDGVRLSLTAAGYHIKDDIPLDGFRRFQTTDPFGNRVELLSPNPLPADLAS